MNGCYAWRLKGLFGIARLPQFQVRDEGTVARAKLGNSWRFWVGAWGRQESQKGTMQSMFQSVARI